MTPNQSHQSPLGPPRQAPISSAGASTPPNAFRLLGISNQNVGPFGLLGVSPEINDRTAILHALRNQLARLERHPEGHSPEAHRLRRDLQKAADLLLEPKTRAECRRTFYGETEPPAPPPSPAPPTRKSTQPRPFSTVSKTPPSVIANQRSNPTQPPITGATAPPSIALLPNSSAQSSTSMAAPPISVAKVDPIDAGITLAIATAGGWNVRARRRIAAVALEYQLPPEALARRIVQAVQVAGRRNVAAWQHPGVTRRPAKVPTLAPAPQNYQIQGAAIALTTLAADATPAQSLASAIAAPATNQDAPLDPEIAAEEAAHRTAVRNMTAAFVAFFFGLLVIIPLGTYILIEISSSSSSSNITENSTSAPDVSAEVDEIANTTALTANIPAPVRNTKTNRRVPLTFSAALEELESDLHAAAGLPESVSAKFKILIEQTRHAWVRFDDHSLERLRAFIVSALYEKGTDTEAARGLLEIIDPLISPSSDHFDPATVQPIIWSEAMLTILAAEAGLPATARNELEDHRRRRQNQRPDLPRNQAARVTFQAAAQQSLLAIVPRLLAGRAEVEAWQRWSETLQTLNLPPQETESIVCRTLFQLFDSSLALNISESARSNALILMTNVDWNQAAEARRSVLAWFSDPRVTAGDLTIITAYLVTNNEVPGLDASFILSVDANMEKRAQLNAQLAAAWKPAATAASRNAPTALDADMVDWLARAERILSAPLAADINDREAALTLLLQTARLNAAAYLFESTSVTEARQVLASTDLKLLEAQIKAELSALKTAAVTNAAAKGNTVLSDGEFALAFAAAVEHNDHAGREELLQDLRHGLADDLGPADAAALVRLALTGSPRGIRELALDTISTRFARGPIVLQRLADSISPDQPSRAISILIEEITTRALPDTKSRNWFAEARFALLEYILNLTGTSLETTRIDAVSALLAQAYALRGGTDSQSVSNFFDPADAADDCFNTWLTRAQPMLPINPIPASRRDIERRRETRLYFQRDPIGAFAATQFGILEAAIYVTAAERPAAVTDLLNILNEANRQRAAATTGLDQLIHVERAILKVWIIRVRLAWGVNP